MLILIIKLNNILKFDMLRLDLCLLYTFIDKDHEMYMIMLSPTNEFSQNLMKSLGI